jgi:hypothetical protein
MLRVNGRKDSLCILAQNALKHVAGYTWPAGDGAVWAFSSATASGTRVNWPRALRVLAHSDPSTAARC